MSHPFGDLLRQYRARKANLSQTRLAELAGYDRAILVRMGQGKKDLTGPSGRERVVRLIGVLHDEGALTSLDEANALLAAARMPALYPGQPDEAVLIQTLRAISSFKAADGGVLVRHNLPAQLTLFIGREREMAEVTHLLSETRLLTLTGSGGCGKTRLALEVGATFEGACEVCVPTFHDGVWLVRLAPLADSDLVADTVAAALNLPSSNRTILDVLTDYLRHKHLLLILDNCEHLVGACAWLAEALLLTCPALHIMATSREALNIPGETAWRVPSLADDEAARLFVDRARTARPGFILSDENDRTITQICARLDSIPLAIELAAARLRTLSVEGIASRLDDRFRLLTGGSRTALPRHQTLRATIDWSYDLLSDAERALLRRLSVFAGGWSLEAAEALYGSSATLDLLEQLVNKSLVLMDESESTAQPRYRLLETVRQYAQERLEQARELEPARQSHLAYFTRLAEEVDVYVDAIDQKSWIGLVRLDKELDNLRAALAWATHSTVPHAQAGPRLVAALGLFWLLRAYTREGLGWIRQLILDRSDVNPQWHMMGLFWASCLASNIGDPVWVDWGNEAHALARQLGDERVVVATRVRAPIRESSYEREIAEFEERVQLARQAGLTWWVAHALNKLGEHMRLHGDLERAGPILTESVALFRQVGDVGDTGGSLVDLGRLAFQRGDGERAIALFDEGVALVRSVNYPYMLSWSLTELAVVVLHQGHFQRAGEALHETFEIYRRIGDPDGLVRCLCVSARLAQLTGRPELAVRLLAAVEDRRPNLPPLSFTLQEQVDDWLAALRTQLGPADFDRAWALGCTMTHEQAVDVACAMLRRETDAPSVR